MHHDDLVEVQKGLEREMVTLGMEAYDSSTRKKLQSGSEFDTFYGKVLSKAMVRPLATGIHKFIEETQAGKAGRRASAFKYMEPHDPLVLALIVVRAVVDGISTRRRLQGVAMAIADGIETEAKLALFEKEKKELYQVVLKDVKKRTNNRKWQQKVLTHSMGKVEIEWDSWPKAARLHLGQKCLSLLIETTGLFSVVTHTIGKNNTPAYLQPTPECIETIAKLNGQGQLLCPHYLPMVTPPVPWTDPYSGGYHTARAKTGLIKTANRHYLEEVSNRGGRMGAVYTAINGMQETAWAVNKQVLEVVKHIQSNDLPLGALPPRDDIPLPPKPHDIDTNETSLANWKRAASRVYNHNFELVSKRMMVDRIMFVANKFAGYDDIYFPHSMDFRGRSYAIPNHLNPQGPDIAKALLMFSKGKPINDDRALGWLMIHGANVFGEDKVPLADRVGWVLDREQEILAVANDPLGNTWWSDADKPFCFLAFCFEYAGFMAHGWGFVSHIPVALDGSCNGLQHFAAIMRDKVGGEAVNLIPSPTPNDIYQRVADAVAVRLQNETGEKKALADQWSGVSFNRSLTKRPVMIVPYSGTVFAVRDYVADWIEKECQTTHPWRSADGSPDSKALNSACTYMASLIWESIGDVVQSARQVMGWLQKTSRVASKSGLPINWETPDGFPVQQAYPDLTRSRVKTHIGDQLVYLTLVDSNDSKLDKRRQANGIAPNFVHSMDAAALRMYVNLALDNGITSFALIHDSYGTLAADTDLSAACLRHAFVEMYEGECVLENLRDSVCGGLTDKEISKVPPIPSRGSLDLSKVRDSEYFFA